MDSVLTLIDYDLAQPEVEGVLTLSDLLRPPKMKTSTWNSPVSPPPLAMAAVHRKASLQDQASAPSGTSTPIYLSTANRISTPRQQRHCSSPASGYLGSKISFSGRFINRIRRASCDAILLKKDENHLSQNPPLQEEVNKKNTTNQSIKKESMSDDQGNHIRLFPETKRVASSETSHSQSHALTDSFQLEWKKLKGFEP
ncbi:Rho GTPase-activating protein 20 [Camelus dromedarius]|uniref:Rho GTPase-activating protein 20 n=1 Tax=Camelus dromedarius TaxID=9838 RepID=A0A5N4CCS1_CAMDR|nr:Rho GTPase-activating protein 20 [Camelus dromedarius]